MAPKTIKRRPKKAPKIVTERPDPAPVLAYRYGAAVIVEVLGRREILTPPEAMELAAVLVLQADLARRTPTTGPQGCRQLPDE